MAVAAIVLSVLTKKKENFENDSMVVFTGATDSYFEKLKRMVGSIQKLDPNRVIYVYDFGLSDSQRREIPLWQNVYYRPLNLSKYPRWIERRVKNISGPRDRGGPRDIGMRSPIKLLALKELMDEISQPVLWIDAGSHIGRSLDPIEKTIKKQGYFFSCTSPDKHMKTYTHSGMLSYIGHPEYKEYLGHIAGSVFGFEGGKDTFVYKNIVIPAFNCTLDKNCMEPEDATLKNHRYDASILSALVEKNGLTVRCNGVYLNDSTNYCTEDVPCYNGVSDKAQNLHVIHISRGGGPKFDVKYRKS